MGHRLETYTITCKFAPMGRHPCTPGPGRCPWEPQFDAFCIEASGAHAYGRMRAGKRDPALGIREPCAGALILRQTSFAGGLGACYAPSGEREGRSPFASTRQRIREVALPQPYCDSATN
jgi:hypothetical protein